MGDSESSGLNDVGAAGRGILRGEAGFELSLPVDRTGIRRVPHLRLRHRHHRRIGGRNRRQHDAVGIRIAARPSRVAAGFQASVRRPWRASFRCALSKVPRDSAGPRADLGGPAERARRSPRCPARAEHTDRRSRRRRCAGPQRAAGEFASHHGSGLRFTRSSAHHVRSGRPQPILTASFDATSVTPLPARARGA